LNGAEGARVAILPIYIFDQPILRRKAKGVKRADDEVTRLASDMLETMYNASGIGLAATQVGSLHRLLVVDIAEAEQKSTPAPIVFLNPEIVDEEGSITMEEGCLSLPDLRDNVDRPEKIVVRYRDLQFREQELTADGLLSRVIQHELDHLNGILFFDRLNIVRRKLLQGRLNKMKRGEATVTYPAIGAIEVPRDPNAPRILND
jgi:peptide deformylase